MGKMLRSLFLLFLLHFKRCVVNTVSCETQDRVFFLGLTPDALHQGNRATKEDTMSSRRPRQYLIWSRTALVHFDADTM